MDAFEEGYAFFEKQAGVQFACHEGGVYVDQDEAFYVEPKKEKED